MSEKKENSKKDATDGLAARIKKAMKECGGGCCGGSGCCDTKIVPKKTRETEEKD